jgi:CheY-like chemotaxis protein
MDNPRQTVLLVEDDPVIRKLVKMYLERMGLLVVEAADGRSALRLLTEMAPDLACLDLVLPESSGYEVCEFIRSSPAMRDIPILVMSGRALPEERAHAVEIGASAYLIKPFTRAEFTNQVDMLLRTSAARQISSQMRIRQQVPHQVPDVPPQGSFFSYRQMRNYFGYAAGALRRRKLLAAVVFSLVALGTVGSLLVLPKTYFVETRIWAQSNQPMPSLANTPPSRSDADVPTRAAPETILRRDNLVALIKQTDLLADWKISYFPLPWLKERLVSVIRGRTTEEDKVSALTRILENQLWVKTGESTVTIGIVWPDATRAYQLVVAAQQSFLEARHALEISHLAGTISILEWLATNARESIEATLVQIQRARDAKSGKLPATPKARPNHEQLNPELARIAMMLNAKRREITDLEDFRQRRLEGLRTQLLEKTKLYELGHAAALNLQRSIDALSNDSALLASMKKDEQELLSEYRRLGGNLEDVAAGAAPRPPLDTVKVRREASSPGDDPSLDYAKQRLSNALSKYDTLQERIDGTRIELDTERAAFKQRYAVILPAQMPKKAMTPTALLATGFIAALLLAFVTPIAAELRAARIVQSWQVEHHLSLPVLAEVREP